MVIVYKKEKHKVFTTTYKYTKLIILCNWSFPTLKDKNSLFSKCKQALILYSTNKKRNVGYTEDSKESWITRKQSYDDINDSLPTWNHRCHLPISHQHLTNNMSTTTKIGPAVSMDSLHISKTLGDIAPPLVCHPELPRYTRAITHALAHWQKRAPLDDTSETQWVLKGKL